MDRAVQVVRDFRGDVIVIGTTAGGISATDILTVKYSGTDGAILWSRRYGQWIYGDDIPSALVVDSRGNVTVAGRTPDGGDNYYVAQYASADGELLWEQRHDDTPVGGAVSSGPLLVLDSDDGIFLATTVLEGNGAASYVAKYSATDGTLLWDKRRVREAITHEDTVHALAVDAQGDVVIAGRSHSEGPARYYITKYAGQDGALRWEQTASDRYGQALAVDGHGNVIVAGTAINGDGYPGPCYTAKRAAADGRLLWEMHPNVSLWSDQPVNPWGSQQVAVDTDGNVLVTGSSNGFDPESETDEPGYRTIKYAAESGHLIWEQFRRTFMSFGWAVVNPQSISVDEGGNVFVAGLASWLYYSDCYTAKYAAADGRVLWEQSYNGPGDGFDMARAVTTDATGNVFMTGESYGGLSQADFYTAKYAAADGALLWQQRYEGSADYESSGRAVTLDRVGNVVVTGGDSTGNYTAKYAATGELLWEQRLKRPQDDVGGEGWAVLTDRQGDVFVTGGRFVAKYAAEDGAIVWATQLEGGGRDMKLDASGNVLVTGWVQRFPWGSEYYTAKLDAEGKLLWQRRYHGATSDYDEAAGLAVDGAGNVIVTGTTKTGTHGNYLGDYYTAKYSATDGSLLWEHRYDGPGHDDDVASGIAIDTHGNVVVTGTSVAGRTAANDKNYDIYTAKYAAADGALLWERRYNGYNGYDDARGIAVDASGNVLITGTSRGGAGSIYTAKYAAKDGALLWDRHAGGIPYHYYHGGMAVTLDASGNVLVTGSSDGEGAPNSDSDYYTAKYASIDGAVLWEKRFAGSGGTYDYPSGLAVGPGGVVAVTGSSGFDLTTVVYRETLPPISLGLAPNGVLLHFTGESGLTYRIERTVSLNGPWSTIAAATAPMGGKIEYLDTDPLPGSAFYRASEQ